MKKIKAMFIKYKNELIQLIKNGFIGVINTVLDIAIFAFLHNILGLPFVFLKKGISYTCGLINSFIMNRVWVFKEHKQKLDRRQLVKFTLVNLTSYGVSALIIRFLVNTFGMEASIANILVAPVTLVINFTGYKLWVFKQNPGEKAEAVPQASATTPEGKEEASILSRQG